MNPAYGPPYACATPKLCASPATICAPHDAGGSSAASESASVTTAIGMVALAFSASRISGVSASTFPKKFGDYIAKAAYSVALSAL